MNPIRHFVSRPEKAELSGPALCALCAEEGNCCCATDPALGHLSFPLSGAEWSRLTPWQDLAGESEKLDGPAFALAEQRAGAIQDEDLVGLADPATSDGALPAWKSEAGADAVPDPAGGAGAAPDLGGERQAKGRAPENGDACCQPWPNSPEFIASMKALFPQEKERIEQLFPAGARHLSLRLRLDGSCVFLGAAGCRLPRHARPLYCRLFPVWFTDLGPNLFAARGCLVAERAQNPAHGIRLLGIDRDEARALFARLRRDWDLESK